MKKTVSLTNLIKAKKDLEVHINVTQIKMLKTLFDPDFDLKDLMSKMDSLEDQLVIVKEAIQLANSTTKDSDGNSINNSIYILSKYNRKKSSLKLILDRIETNNTLNVDSLKDKLLKDVKDLGDLIVKETDQKKKSELESNKRRLKRSLTKISTKKEAATLKEETEALLKLVEEQVKKYTDKLSLLNNSTTVEVEIFDGFSLIIT